MEQWWDPGRDFFVIFLTIGENWGHKNWFLVAIGECLIRLVERDLKSDDKVLFGRLVLFNCSLVCRNKASSRHYWDLVEVSCGLGSLLCLVMLVTLVVCCDKFGGYFSFEHTRQTRQEQETDAKLFIVFAKAYRSFQKVCINVVVLERTVQSHFPEELAYLFSVVCVVNRHSHLEAD